MAALITVTDNSFDAQVLKSDLLVITEFWAEWCVPCKTLEPLLNDLADVYGNQVKVVRVDIEENPMVTSSYEVLIIPTLILFKNGVIVERMSLEQAKEELREKVGFYLREFAR
ncbi:MAG: thiol reductase thioredoxin [Anaerolineae bacterium]|nr:thiol reductase thioredoxin [Anaerolineae bacterium]